MQAHINPVRAVGAEFFQRKFHSLSLLFIVGSILLAIIMAVLISLVSPWWTILAVLLFFCFMIGAALLLATRILINTLRPQISQTQKTVVSDFVDKFERVTEQIGTPWFIIAFKIAKDVLLPPQGKTYIESVAHDGTTLHTDYLVVDRAFK